MYTSIYKYIYFFLFLSIYTCLKCVPVSIYYTKFVIFSLSLPLSKYMFIVDMNFFSHFQLLQKLIVDNQKILLVLKSPIKQLPINLKLHIFVQREKN